MTSVFPSSRHPVFPYFRRTGYFPRMTDVVALAAELLALQSSTGAEGPAVDFISRWLITRGWNVTSQEVAKGSAAAMLCAAERLADAGEKRVDLLFVVGEEKGSDGARAANHLQATSKYLVNGEPTESKLASGAKGSQRVVVRTRGRAAHSAYAHLGVSAIEPMLALLPSVTSLPLPTDPVLGETTVNIGTIRGGTEANIVPDLCEAELMFRLVGDVAPLRASLTKWAGDRAELEWGSYIPAQHFHTIPGFEVSPVAYTSDIPLLSRWGTPLLFGPGSIHVAHTTDEFIDVQELRQAVDSYERIVRTLLAS